MMVIYDFLVVSYVERVIMLKDGDIYLEIY